MVAGRLEDKRDSVRLKAIQSLRNILLKAPRLDSLKGMPDFENILKSLHLLFISVDDSNEQIQDSILGMYEYEFFFVFIIFQLRQILYVYIITEIFKVPQIVTNVKSVFPEEIISSFIRKCRHKNVSTMLETCLKI